MSSNDITGDEIKTKASSEAYRSGYDRIFRQREQIREVLYAKRAAIFSVVNEDADNATRTHADALQVEL